MTYDEWFTLYLSLYKRKLKPKTRESYTRLHDLLAPILGAIDLAAINPDRVQAAMLAVEEQAGSRQAQLAYTLVRACLARAVRSGHLAANPADAVDKPQHETQPGRAISAEDWAALRPVIVSDLAFALLGLAGLRRGEALGLCWGDVDLRAGVLHVRRALVRVDHRLMIQSAKSRAGERDVPIAPELLPLLRAQYRFAPDRRVIGCAPETLARRWRRAQLEAGVMQPYRLHDLRHTYATRLVLAGCNLRVLQYMIGHSSFELTANTYTHISAADAVTEYKRVSGSLH